MEKLIELLNESAKFDFIFENRHQVNFRKLKIISKEYGFIKWLVENDKIDLDEVERYSVFGYTYYQNLLMLLSISDDPIRFLISILK